MDDTAQRLLYKAANFLYAYLGLTGAERVDDTSTHSGRFWSFHAITTSVIASIVYDPTSPGGALAGDTIAAGDRVAGLITSFSLASGIGELSNV